MIAKRRAQIDDPHREALPEAPDSDPREVVDYLRDHSRAGLPTWVLQADVCDALTINNWLWWEDRRRELYFLRAGVASGLSLSQIGTQIGVGKQGVRDRIDRLDALLRFDRPDEKLIREERHSKQARQQSQATETDWLNSRRESFLAIAHSLVAHAGDLELPDTDREWLDELAVDAHDNNLSPATMVILGLATAEIRTAHQVLTLPGDRPHPIHALLARADSLRSQYAALGGAANS